ncbi:hypothetical protein HY732_03550 [Candidatus Uhrbacteria bacterium]|nr:hypothetical protein [Candidatus Uhrbacteria bacterium]
MNKLFLIQLIISFIVGGSFIALLSFIAEKAGSRISGIIIAFPSTAALSFFFLGWALSPQAVADIVPSTLIPLALAVLFTAVYAYAAEYFERIIKNRIWQIIMSYSVSIGFWFALTTPLIVLKLNNLAVGMVGYALIVLAAHLLLHRKHHEKPIAFTYTFGQKIGRALFVGVIVFLAVFFGKILNPFWGGMFAMFPAAYSSLMIIFHWYYGPQGLFPAMQKVAIGSLSLCAYALMVMFAFPAYGFIYGTIIAYVVSLIISLILIRFQQRPS